MGYCVEVDGMLIADGFASRAEAQRALESELFQGAECGRVYERDEQGRVGETLVSLNLNAALAPAPEPAPFVAPARERNSDLAERSL